MSVHVVSWALRYSESKLGDRLVLLALAEAAHDDGKYAFPKVATIATRANLSERQVQRCLRNLADLGEIEQTGKTKSGTNVYSITGYIRHDRGDNMSPLRPEGVTPTSPPGVTPTSPELSVEPSVELSMQNGKPKNEIWDALAVIFGEPTTRPAQRERGQIVRDLTEAGATPDDIFARSKRWAKHFDHATLTAHALVKHWDTLPLTPRRVPR